MSQQQSPPQNTTVVVMAESPEANIAIRAAWFMFAGWWMSFWAISAAALLQLTIIGIPAAVWIVNRIPQVSTLKSSRRLQVAERQAGVTVVSYADREQLKWWVRVIYYVLVGWWATVLWLYAAWFCSFTILLLPVSFLMFGQTGMIQALRR